MVEEKTNEVQIDTNSEIVVEMLRNKMKEEFKNNFASGTYETESRLNINEEKHKTGTEADAIIKSANHKFLLDVLSPEIRENENKKRKHKDWLMCAMGTFLLLQFLIVAVIVAYSGYWIIYSHVNHNPFPDSTLKIIFAFIGTYITSVVIELIAILKYIVKNVFDTSITGMVDNSIQHDDKE